MVSGERGGSARNDPCEMIARKTTALSLIVPQRLTSQVARNKSALWNFQEKLWW